MRTPYEEDLSDRELAVLRLLATDLTQREIGEALYVSFNTVKTHVKSIFRKLDVAARTDAVSRARELRLLCPSRLEQVTRGPDPALGRAASPVR